MTIVYPLVNQINHTELKFSLRSIEKYFAGSHEVVIIGSELPDWIVNITHINLPDQVGRKQFSIRRKILIALEYADSFLFMNDDIFFVKPVTKFPYYWHGMLKKYAESGTRQVERDLTRLNKPLKLFDGHYPLIYNKQFKEVSEHFHPDCIIKSMYCNYLEIEGEFFPDCKLLTKAETYQVRRFIEDKPCFSTGVLSLKSALPVLNELFPVKSKFEL